MFTFCQRLYHRKCQRRGVGGQKSRNLVNVVCERPPTCHHAYHPSQCMVACLLNLSPEIWPSLYFEDNTGMQSELDRSKLSNNNIQ